MTNVEAPISDDQPRSASAAVNASYKYAQTQTINAGGVNFAYRQLGPDTGVPVIFLHHLFAVLDDWDPRVIDGIAAKHRVITFDNRGVGASSGRVPHTVEEMARDAAAFIRALGFEKVDVLGFSMGGGIAQTIALQEPQLVRKLILAGTGPAGGGGINEITRIAILANIRGALTFKDARQFLFFSRTPDGKKAASAYMSRLKERTEDRDKRISPLARRAQLKAIRAFGDREPQDLSAIPTAGPGGKR
jgi:pimeloyl-ACP methyl ester carboxylesterase